MDDLVKRWGDLSKRDDVLDMMVPSDVRGLVARIRQLEAEAGARVAAAYRASALVVDDRYADGDMGNPGHHIHVLAQSDPDATAALERVRAEEREKFMPAIASLAAAISLLEKGGKKAAPSDKMFDQMLDDYRRALESARAMLKKESAE